ncbi:MAG: 50S ribosomal protein L28 [Bacteroidales bacterium]|nr:50S ribosomal protein L28 [Bacteroidales bacterium]
MSKVCQITGRKVMVGNNVSHSNKKTKRTFSPNLKIKKFYVPEWDEWVVLKVSAAGLRTIDKKGVYQAMIDASEKGHLDRW